MFDRNSRYAGVKALSTSSIKGTRPRPIPNAQGVIEHTLVTEDRLDRLAAYYYGDPSKWWMILDANPEISFSCDLNLADYIGEVIVIPIN